MSETAPLPAEPVRSRGGANRERPPRQAGRLAWLDALRGFAALCVVFDHGSTLLLLPVRTFLYQWLNLGQYGVFVFFLVSGYIVPASLERKGSVRGFWISRAFRLYPMFLVALVLSAVAYKTGHGTFGNSGAHPVAAVLSWLLMLQNLTTGLNVPVVTWTLSYEMVFYLLIAALFSWGVHRRSGWYATAFAVGAVALGGLLPMSGLGHWTKAPGLGPLLLSGIPDALILAGLLLAVRSRARTARAGASLAALVGLVLVTFNQNYPYPWSGCVILALMFTGTLLYRAEQRQVSRTAAAAVTVAVLALATFGGLWHGARYGHHWQVQWATSVLLAGATFGLGLVFFGSGAARGRRVPRWCAWLGMISYSVYLLHPLVFDAYRSFPALHRRHTLPDQALFFAALLAVIIGLSAFCYYFVEKPMQRLGRRVAARVDYRTAAASAAGPAALDGAPDGVPEGVPDEAGAGAGAGTEASAGDGGQPAAATRSASSSSTVAGGSGG
jgi:peptidoglycan/LPS O-acetylase OafA/YrhL